VDLPDARRDDGLEIPDLPGNLAVGPLDVPREGEDDGGDPYRSEHLMVPGPLVGELEPALPVRPPDTRAKPVYLGLIRD